ncbi:hypothetical protein LCGC14_0542520 [marine sediment metagenome]|uniref:HTH merR-type domain-containing protein n=1 Tax=marine sediment metagenome TaxID=412755 RepID=A0A0F9SAY4_9ZZZZ
MELLTIAQIADQLGEHKERIRHIVSYRGIKEIRRAGTARMYNPNVVPVIKKFCYNLRIQK